MNIKAPIQTLGTVEPLDPGWKQLRTEAAAVVERRGALLDAHHGALRRQQPAPQAAGAAEAGMAHSDGLSESLILSGGTRTRVKDLALWLEHGRGPSLRSG